MEENLSSVPAKSDEKQELLRQLGFWLAVLVIWCVAWLSQHSLSALVAAGAATEHTQEVRYEAEHLLSSLTDAETGQRGYIITGDQNYIEPYNAAVKEAPRALARLHNLTAENPDQQRHVDLLQPLVAGRLDSLAKNLNYRRAKPQDVFAAARLAKGKLVMDELRSRMAEILTEESKLYSTTKANAENRARISSFVLFGGILLSSGMIAGLFYLMQWETRRRRAAEAMIRSANDELEEKVQLRTAEIEQKTEFLRATLESMQDAVFISKDARIVFANSACVALLGAESTEQVIGRSPFEFLQADYHHLMGERVNTFAHSGAAVQEAKIACRNGRVVEAELMASRFMDQGSPAILVSARDITARKSAEQQLLSHLTDLQNTKRELESTTTQLRAALRDAGAANETKTQFLANMSHELRTPLNSILGFSEILKKELFGPLGDERYRSYAESVFHSGAHLLGLVNDLLDLAKLDASRLELDQREVDLPELLATCVGFMAPKAEQAKVRLHAHCDDAAKLIWADERRLRQILLNLISNAVKFTPEGGQVRVSAFGNDENIAITVTDTGIGIAPEDIPRVMERFGQIDSALSRKHEGTGLGLPLSKQLVELHGGKLYIDSEIAVGTTITVSIPSFRISAAAA